jgi:hypothetical protein
VIEVMSKEDKIRMNDKEFVCPFTHNSCFECVLYRGRHYYINKCKEGRGDVSESRHTQETAVPHHAAELQAYFQALENQVEPWADIEPLPETDLHIRLRIINVETGENRVYSLAEVKQWDWSDQETVRQIDGIQIDSWAKLVKVLSYKTESGHEEVKIYEAPRFMVLAGG